MAPRTIVIIGGGFGGVYAAKRLVRLFRRDKQVRVVLINKTNYFLFTPMLHEVATGGIDQRCILEPLREAVKGANFSFHEETVSSVDLKKRQVRCGKTSIDYDFLVLATGAKGATFGVQGVEDHALGLKNITDAHRIKNHIIERFEQAIKDQTVAEEQMTFVVVGGGPTGIELAGELVEFAEQNHRRCYYNINDIKPKIILVHAKGALLHGEKERLQRLALRALQKKGVEVLLNTRVTKVAKNHVILDKKRRLRTRTVLWATGVRPNVPKMVPDITTITGHVPVTGFLCHQKFHHVYALGDCAEMIDPATKERVPKLAQAAVAEAEILAHNIFQRITGAEEMKRFVFRPKGFLVSVGQRFAIADIHGIIFKGFFAWWLWRTIYLTKLLSLKSKIRTVFDWTIDLFYPRDITEVK